MLALGVTGFEKLTLRNGLAVGGWVSMATVTTTRALVPLPSEPAHAVVRASEDSERDFYRAVIGAEVNASAAARASQRA